MKKISIFCVNYKSYKVLEKYLHSIEISAAVIKNMADVDIFIADNTETEYKTISINEYTSINNIRIFPFYENIGYFGAINRMMHAVDTLAYDYVIVSNVDMTLRPNTLSSLINEQYSDNIGWIAPAIISEVNQRDLNPQTKYRYTTSKLKIMRWLYRLPILYNTYVLTLHKLRRRQMRLHKAGPIYAGHGSFIILTHEFILRCGIINYPVFLYCEEIYLAEECKRHGLSVIYSPSITVNDIGKVSTSKVHRSTYYRWNIEGLTYIIDKYYK